MTATTALKVAPAKPAPTPATPPPAAKAEPGLSPEQERQWIAEAAYFLAEKRGFAPEGAREDWLVAEQALTDAMRKRAH